MQTLPIPCPLFRWCAKSRLFLHREASQSGGGELLHPPLCQDGGFDGLQLRAWLGAVQRRVRGSHGALERGTEESLRCRRATSDSWLYKTGDQSSHIHKQSQKHLSCFVKESPLSFLPKPPACLYCLPWLKPLQTSLLLSHSILYLYKLNVLVIELALG